MNINLQQIFKSSLWLLLLALIPISGFSQIGLQQKETGFVNETILIHIRSVDVKPTILTGPTKGEISAPIKIDPLTWQIEYQPFDDFIGFDKIIVENVTDYFPNVAVGLVRTDIHLKIVPSLVETQHDYGITEEGETVSIKVVGNDSVSHGEVVLEPIFPVVNHGKVSLSAQQGFVDFKPESGFTGLADFNYIACDSIGTCATGAASIYVNPIGKIYNDTIRLGTGQNTKKAIPMPFMVTNTDQPDNVKIEASQYAVVYEPAFEYAGQQIITVEGNGHKRVIIMDVIERTNNFLSLADNDISYALLGETVQLNVTANDNIKTVRGVNYYALNGGEVNDLGNGLMEFVPSKGFSGVARVAYMAYDEFFKEHWAYAYIIYNRHNFGPNDQDYEYVFDVNPGQTKNIDYLAPINNYQLLPDENSETYGEIEAMSKGSLIYYAPEEAGFSDEFEILYCAPANAHPDDCQKVKITMNITDKAVSSGCSNDCVLPGDINSDGIVNSIDLLPLGLHIGAQGPRRSDRSTVFEPHLAADWNMGLIEGASANLKHHDANGDGVLTEKDVQAILDNYGQVNHLVPYSQAALSKGIAIQANRVTPSLEEVPSGESIPAGTLIEIEIALGEEDAQELDLYGFTFPFKMSGRSFIDPTSFKVTFHDDSWAALNSPTLTLQKEVESDNPEQISLDFGFTRTSRSDVSGSGRLATVGFIVIEDHLEFKLPNAKPFFDIEIGDAYSIDGNGQYYQYAGTKIDIPFSFNKEDKEETTINAPKLKLYPNPASDRMTMQFEDAEQIISNVAVFNMAGQEVYRSVNLDVRYFPIPVAQLSEGMYIAQAMTEAGLISKKFQVVR